MSFTENLRSILEVPSFFLQEDRMIEKIESILAEIPGVRFWKDMYGTIYVIKGESDFYPLVCAHTDTVHHLEEYIVHEFDSTEGRAFKALRPNGEPSGIGGDNKTGIFVCLELLKTQEVLKAAFFIGEEYGCVGSTLAHPTFFENVGYALEFDAPDFYWITRICNGIQLFDPAGEFWKIASPIMATHTDGLLDPCNGNHPYTDMYPLKGYYDFSCLNYSSGYMKMHSRQEYVVIGYVQRALDTAKKLLSALGNTKYRFISTLLDREIMIQHRSGDTRAIKYPEQQVA